MRVARAPGMPGTFSSSPRGSDPDMHHGTCVTHVPWCMSGSLTSSFLWNRWRGNVPGIPGACATRNFTYLVGGPLKHNNTPTTLMLYTMADCIVCIIYKIHYWCLHYPTGLSGAVSLWHPLCQGFYTWPCSTKSLNANDLSKINPTGDRQTLAEHIASFLIIFRKFLEISYIYISFLYNWGILSFLYLLCILR